MNLPPVAASGTAALDPLKVEGFGEGFDVRQPQHIALAGALGMGYFDFKSPKGRRLSIKHTVVNAWNGIDPRSRRNDQLAIARSLWFPVTFVIGTYSAAIECEPV